VPHAKQDLVRLLQRIHVIGLTVAQAGRCRAIASTWPPVAAPIAAAIVAEQQAALGERVGEAFVVPELIPLRRDVESVPEFFPLRPRNRPGSARVVQLVGARDAQPAPLRPCSVATRVGRLARAPLSGVPLFVGRPAGRYSSSVQSFTSASTSAPNCSSMSALEAPRGRAVARPGTDSRNRCRGPRSSHGAARRWLIA